jgi:hypothetical protein
VLKIGFVFFIVFLSQQAMADSLYLIVNGKALHENKKII